VIYEFHQEIEEEPKGDGKILGDGTQAKAVIF